MNKTNKIIICIALILTMAALISCSSKSDNKVKVENMKILHGKTADDFGTWKIDFSRKVDINEEMYKNIKILSEEGIPVKVKISYADYEKKSILIKSEDNGFEVNRKYILSISEIKSDTGIKLEKPYVREFTLKRTPLIIKDAKIIDENYTWQVTFDQEILIGDNTIKNINVYDSNDEEIDKKVSYKDSEKNVLLVELNKEQLKINEKYTFVVKKNVDNEWNTRLFSDLSEEFLIKQLIIDESLGLGKVETARKSNDREYEYYIDQGDTGKYSEQNGGVAAAVMAARWFSKKQKYTIEGARSIYYPGGDSWYTETIFDYLKENRIDSFLLKSLDEEILKKEIDDGNIAIIKVNFKEITFNNNLNSHVHKFDRTIESNYLLVKGYRVVDEKLYFEVYDPYSLGRRYEDNTLKGKDRYYESKDMINAVKSLGEGSIIIKQKQ